MYAKRTARSEVKDEEQTRSSAINPFLVATRLGSGNTACMHGHVSKELLPASNLGHQIPACDAHSSPPRHATQSLLPTSSSTEHDLPRPLTETTFMQSLVGTNQNGDVAPCSSTSFS